MSHKILLVLFFLSGVLAVRIIDFTSQVKPYSPGEKISFEATIDSQPKIISKGQRISLTLPNSQRVSILFPLIPRLSYGDRLKIEGIVQYFDGGNGQKVAYMNYPKFEIAKLGNKSFLNRLRQKLVDFFDSSMGSRESALMLGIVFGIKEEMDPTFHTNLQNTGLLHVIAASGMNITMVGGFLLAFFSLFLRRQIAITFSIVGILFYSLLAGLQPSIVRAAIMGILVFSAQLTGRQTSAFLSLFGAGFIMLMLNPSLIFDVGFQLSFLATFGLIFLRPIFVRKKKVRKLVEKSLVGEDLVTTLSAQLATLPILIGNFSSYGLASVFVNAAVLWTVPILMIIGGIAAILALIFEPLGHLINYLSLPFLYYFEWVVNSLGGFGALLKVSSLPISITLGYYLLILALIVKSQGKK